MNPVLFLDIDGVLQSHHVPDYEFDFDLNNKLAKELHNDTIKSLNIYFTNQICFGFDPDSCLYLRNLVEEFDARIVLTSSWRLYYTRQEIEAMFDILGMKGAYLGNTKIGTSRSEVIKQFVKEHNIEQYLIIDDFNLSKAFGSRFIRTYDHFDQNNYNQARFLLKLAL